MLSAHTEALNFFALVTSVQELQHHATIYCVTKLSWLHCMMKQLEEFRPSQRSNYKSLELPHAEIPQHNPTIMLSAAAMLTTFK